MLHPMVCCTWASQGETSTLDCWDLDDRLSVISAITVSPLRRRLGLYFDIFDHNIVADDFEEFVAKLLGRIGNPIALVTDHWQVHKSGVAKLRARFGRRVRIDWLPPYAPELNPVEQIWSHTKHSDLANYVPDDVLRLGRSVAKSLRDKQTNQPLLRWFFHAAQLRI